jgi:hypothetical protein
MLTETELLVLNATADDVENLEQIYRILALEFSAENYDPDNPDAYYWREKLPPVPLVGIADAVQSLVQRGMLRAHRNPAEPALAAGDKSGVWRSWFELTAAGRQMLQDSQSELSGTATH